MQTQQTPHSSPPDRHQQDELMHISRGDAFNETFFVTFERNSEIKNVEVEVVP